jgi:hypothetical protein
MFKLFLLFVSVALATTGGCYITPAPASAALAAAARYSHIAKVRHLQNVSETLRAADAEAAFVGVHDV